MVVMVIVVADDESWWAVYVVNFFKGGPIEGFDHMAIVGPREVIPWE